MEGKGSDAEDEVGDDRGYSVWGWKEPIGRAG
jgi:hypothetical protein